MLVTVPSRGPQIQIRTMERVLLGLSNQVRKVQISYFFEPSKRQNVEKFTVIIPSSLSVLRL